MRLLYVSNSRIPTEKAHGVQIMKMCEAFAEQGASVELVVPKRRKLIKDDPFDYYGVKKVFGIIKLPTVDLVGFIPKVGFWIESIIFSIFVLFYVAGSEADIVYSRDKIPFWFLSFTGKKIYWEPHVGSWDFVVRRVVTKAEGIVCITDGGKRYFAGKGVLKEKIIVAHDAVDLEDFNVDITKKEARKRLGLPQDKKPSIS